MSSKKWFISFFISFLLIIGGYALFNILVDPFGLFGDVIFDWHSYEMTSNPRVAKIAYLDKNYKNYDSYVVGFSNTSSIPVESLNKYFGGSFYNLFMYGSDMYDIEKICEYIVDNYEVKNLIVNVFISNATEYNIEIDDLYDNLHGKLEGASLPSFYADYMFLTPEHALEKIKAKEEDTYLSQSFDVFVAETGTYDKKSRDAEPIRSLDEYYEAYPVFKNYPYSEIQMNEIDNALKSVKKIKELCDENGINVQFVSSPVYSEYLTCFSKDQVEEFFTKLADITPYWGFISNSITDEPRFFYDGTHIRNALGTMMVAKMAGATDIYIPDDFGRYITRENVADYLKTLWDTSNNTSEYTKRVPVLIYHSISKTDSGAAVVSEREFKKQLSAIKLAGFNTVTIDDMINYVEKGIELPKNPICITFDDGYLDNYEIAFPLLKQYNMKATMFVIGSSIGNNGKYKDTEHTSIPHFTYEQAKEMIDSGLVSIQSHTYDMHQWAPFENLDEEYVRENINQLDIETEKEYIEALREDAKILKEKLYDNLGVDVTALAFPGGYYNRLANVILEEEGIKVTFSTEEGVNELVKGLPQTLYSLKRFNMTEGMNLIQLLAKIRK